MFHVLPTPNLVSCFSDSPILGRTVRRRVDERLNRVGVEAANDAIQSLNASSIEARIARIGLRAIPPMSHLTRLRSLNLSGNFIVDVLPRSLPKSVRVLNLSRNKIRSIHGLKGLNQLRVLDLSHNRIRKIGDGLSNYGHIKEVYLSGNEMTDVEGLPRHAKLTVLDVSFNKIATPEALRELATNDSTLRVLNLVGNPIESAMERDDVRTTVCRLLPNLEVLNKHPVHE